MDPYIGEIKMFAGSFAPNGWFFCDGSLLPISQYSAFFSILGTTYGGDGVSTFKLPDLRGRMAIHSGSGQGPNVSRYNLGQFGGNENVTLTQQQMPMHTHNMAINSVAPTVGLATNAFLGFNANSETGDALPFYSATATNGSNLNPAAISVSGGSQPVNVVTPYLGINFIIAWTGIYPTRP
ncbi:MAG: tail fiber protein [Bacteroidota bacterium]